MTLKILDISPIIYAGNSRKYKISRGLREVDGMIEANVINAGPIKYLIEFINRIRETDSVIIPVMDRTPEIKREHYAKVFGDPNGYKAGRPRVLKDGITKEQVEITKWYAEKMLEDCGFDVRYMDGYEADDVIYTIWKDNVEYFDKVEIYTGDTDLAFMVTPNTEILPTKSNGKHITVDNYTYTVKANRYTKYNSVAFYKLFENGLADAADNIYGVGGHWGEPFASVMTNDNDWKLLYDLDFCRMKIQRMVDLNPTLRNADMILDVFNLLVPYYVDGVEIVNDKDTVNWLLFEDYYLNNFNCDSVYKTDASEDLLEQYISDYSR